MKSTNSKKCGDKVVPKTLDGEETTPLRGHLYPAYVSLERQHVQLTYEITTTKVNEAMAPMMKKIKAFWLLRKGQRK